MNCRLGTKLCQNFFNFKLFGSAQSLYVIVCFNNSCRLNKNPALNINNSNALKQKYLPLWTNLSTEEILATNLQFWGIGDDGKLSDGFSVLGGYYDDSDKYLDTDAYAEIKNLFENENSCDNIIKYVRFKFTQ